MTPSFIMTIGAVSGILALISLLVNFMALAARGKTVNLVLHIIFALWVGASWITFLAGLVMFLINYAKHA